MRRRCQGDRGQIGGIEVLPFGFLIFVSATLLFANVWGIIDAKFAVSAAARESTRAFVEAGSESDARAAAASRGAETLEAYGRGGERGTIAAPELTEPFGRCARVTITATYDVPTLTLPFIGGLGTLAPVESTHTEIVDPFRNGLAGTAAC